MDTIPTGSNDATNTIASEVVGQEPAAASGPAEDGHKAELRQRADRQEQAAKKAAETDGERIGVKVASYRQEVELWNRVAQAAVAELRTGLAPQDAVLDLLDFVQGKIKATGGYNVL